MNNTANYLLNIENEIRKKYGDATIRNPKASWNEEKEKIYLEQIKELSKKEQVEDKDLEHIEIDGVFIQKKLFTLKNNNKICFYCKSYSFNKNDDIYLNKFSTCFKCYIQHVENREDKWLNKLYKENNKEK